MEKKSQNQIACLVVFCVGLFTYGITFNNSLTLENSNQPSRSIASIPGN